MKRLGLVIGLLVSVLTVAAVASADQPAPARYVVRAADVTTYAPKGGKLEARVLVDFEIGATQASLTLLTLRGRTEIPLHRQTSAKVIYVLEGMGRVYGLAGGKGVEVVAGDAVYVPAGVASGLLSTCCKRAPSKFLVLYVPGGPERPFKDPTAARSGPQATTTVPAAEKQKPSPDAPQPKVAKATEIPDLPIAGGKGKVKILFDAASAGDGAAYVGLLTAEAGLAIPEHVHATEAEILWITAGKGEMTVGGETLAVEHGMAVHIPAGVKHSFKSATGLTAVQFYTPSGPEQRFKKAASETK